MRGFVSGGLVSVLAGLGSEIAAWEPKVPAHELVSWCNAPSTCNLDISFSFSFSFLHFHSRIGI